MIHEIKEPVTHYPICGECHHGMIWVKHESDIDGLDIGRCANSECSQRGMGFNLITKERVPTFDATNTDESLNKHG